MNRQHAPRVFDEQAAVDAYKAQYRALALRFGPFVDAVARSSAAGAAGGGVRFRGPAGFGQRATERRKGGRGRNPAAAGVDRLSRREALPWRSYARAGRRTQKPVAPARRKGSRKAISR